MHSTVTTGDRVRCQGRDGKTGTVAGILRDIGNGQRFAVVNIDHDLPGIVEQMPVAELQKLNCEKK